MRFVIQVLDDTSKTARLMRALGEKRRHALRGVDIVIREELRERLVPVLDVLILRNDLTKLDFSNHWSYALSSCI